MKHASLTVLFCLAFFCPGLAQKPWDERIDPRLTDQWSNDCRYNDSRWTAAWVTSPSSTGGSEVLMFRKSLEFNDVPESFVVNASADNRYKLYVNGSFVCDGPAKGDIYNWSFETADIAPFLREGENSICALVWNKGEGRPVAQSSLGKTAFLLQGNTEAEDKINTGRIWKVLRSAAYSDIPVVVRGYYAAGTCDCLDASAYPWGWMDNGYDASSWEDAKPVASAAAKGAGNYHFWQLVPRPIPPMERKPVDFGKELDGICVPAGETREFLLDNHVLTTGYPRLQVSGGQGARIRVSYAEALYLKDKGCDKGDRNVADGKIFDGYYDEFLPDGGGARIFEPLWWRTWRYMKLTVKAGACPVTIDSLRAESSMYPFELASDFDAPGHPELSRMLETGWRTARLCAHETYMDCPYYEQLQYFGDSRIQALVTMFNTRDEAMPRRLLEFGRMALGSDGVTMSRYPSHIHQFIPPYSLVWINSCHDWWMYRGDGEYLSSLLPAMRMVLSTFISRVSFEGSLQRFPFWNFADWAGLDHGVFPADSEGRSAYMDLMLIMALRDAAEMEGSFGSAALAKEYGALADKMCVAAKRTYWCPERQLFADNGEMKDFSQHVNALSILAGLVKGKDASGLFRRAVADTTVRPCTIYFKYYLQCAMKRSGNADMFLDGLDVFREQMALGLGTWAEMPEPSRSDCHAWGASPNIEFFRTLLGIDSAAPGFRRVCIAPALCGLNEVSGSIPHPCGSLSASYKMDGKGRLHAVICLPDGVSGKFCWGGKEKRLKSGNNIIVLKKRK